MATNTWVTAAQLAGRNIARLMATNAANARRAIICLRCVGHHQELQVRFPARWNSVALLPTHGKSTMRPERSVAAAKRGIRDAVGLIGKLDSAKLVIGLMQLRNKPDPDTDLSTVQILLRDQPNQNHTSPAL